MQQYSPKKKNRIAQRAIDHYFADTEAATFRGRPRTSLPTTLCSDLDNTKYHYVVAAFDQATALRVIDVLEDPPQHNKYDNLKRRLTDMFGLLRRQRADQLLDIGLHSLGDRRPSQLMDEMLALLGSHKPCMLFESIFLRCMPEDIRLQLATSVSGLDSCIYNTIQYNTIQ